MYQSTTAGSLTDVYADGLQDVGQFVGMVPKSDGLSMTAIVDMDYERFGVLTLLNLGVDSGDPWEFNAAGGGLELKGKDGTWDGNFGLIIEGGVSENSGDLDVLLDTDLDPYPPDFSTLYLVPPRGYYDAVSDEEEVGLVSFGDCIRGMNPDVIRLPGYIFWRLTCEGELAYPSSGGITRELYIGKTGILLDTGPIKTNAAIWADTPSGAGLSFGVAGSVNGLYGLFSEDVHALDSVYGSAGVVVGFGRQDHSHDGSLWIESEGTDGVPDAGCQETQIKTDDEGTKFINHSGNEEGSVDQRFEFDDEVRATKLVSTTDGADITGPLTATDSDNDLHGTVTIDGPDMSGDVVISNGSTNNTVNITNIAVTDVIVLSYKESSNGGGACWAENISAATSFDVFTTSAVSADTTINWRIIH
jgi:hypothetical protein